MEKSALAQENVWLDKPSYDKAERLYFERLAKVVSHKIMGSSLKSEISVINNDEDNLVLNNKTVNDKVSVECDENILISANLIKYMNSTCQIKTAKSNKHELELQTQKDKNEEDKELTGTSCKGSVRYGLCTTNNMNETKEKKSKSNREHKNKKGKNNREEVLAHITHYVPPSLRKKEQLSIQIQGIPQTISPILSAGGSLANEVAKARQHIKESLQCMDDMAAAVGLTTAPNDNKTDVVDFSVVQELKCVVQKLEGRIKILEDMIQPLLSTVPKEVVCPVKSEPVSKSAAKSTHEKDEGDEDDDDVDLFGSDSEGDDTEAAKLREERLSAYAAKKAKKPALVAKSNIILDVKPWDDETDMKAMEEEVRKIASDGLLWGASKLVPLAYGIHKLQISCVVEDDKISVDWLTEKIQEIEDFVQSVDIAAFNKV